MGVPEEIRRIERPVNTIVYRIRDDRYGVRERAGVKYSANGNPCPINGKVVGYIEKGRFFPLVEKMADRPSILSYGSSALVLACSEGLFEDLAKIYPIETARSIMAMASLKVIKPSIRCGRFESEYMRTYISIFYGGCHLSKNRIGKLLKEIGMDGEKRERFYLARIAGMPVDHHLAIDGTLRQDSSSVNSLSGYSYKSRIKGTRDVSVIYAYDIENREPVCSMVFPGNSVDATSYRQFVVQNSITKGIIVSDKGFPIKAIKDLLEKFPDLHFLTPLRRNDARIDTNDMLSFDQVVDGVDGDIIARKTKIAEDRYLYSFLDISTMGKEAHDFVRHSRKDGSFDVEKYERRRMSFGTIVLESDLDMTCREAYQCYGERWKIELVFRAYKNDEGLKETNVQGDYSVIGMEFINFLSTIITTRAIDMMGKAGLLKNDSYGEVMDDLTRLWRKAESGTGKLTSKDVNWVNAMPHELEKMKALNLLQEEIEKPKKGRGRPRKTDSASH